MPTRTHTLNEARALHAKGEPWRVRLVNDSTRHAFYEVTGTGDGNALVRYGGIGQRGRTCNMHGDKALGKLSQKLRADYRYMSSAHYPSNPERTPPPPRTLRSLHERIGSTTMRPCTRDDLMDKAAACELTPAGIDPTTAQQWHPRADSVTILSGNAGHLRGLLLIVARHGESLTWGVVPKE